MCAGFEVVKTIKVLANLTIPLLPLGTLLPLGAFARRRNACTLFALCSLLISNCSLLIALRLLLHRLVQNHPLDGTLTYGAEPIRYIVAHTADIHRAIDAL